MASERSKDGRLACLLIPAMPLAAALRAHPELTGRPFAVVSAAGPRAEILAVSPEAARSAVRPGTTVVHARAACADLHVQIASPALERAARDALLDAALSTSPRAELAPAHSGLHAAEAAAFVDARGVEALFHSEAGFASALGERAARLGLPGVVAVAGSRGAARILARQLAFSGESVRIVPPGGDAEALAPLPLDLLNPDDDLANALTRFGLSRVSDLLRLPERALTQRLGARIVPLLELARGRDRSPPPPAETTPCFEEAQELEFPVHQLEPLLFVLNGMLSRLLERLTCRGLALGDLELELGFEGGGCDARRVGLAAPTLDPRLALRLVALSLESKPPDEAPAHVRLATAGAALRGDQLDFFRSPGPSPAVLDHTLAELSALCGAERVGAPAVADDHHPDAYEVAAFRPPKASATAAAPSSTTATSSSKTAAPSSKTDRPHLALRALRPPVRAQVDAPGGQPRWVRSPLANGEVVHCAGPWRTTGRWWSENDRYAFDHYDVQTGDGWVFRLRKDHVGRCWSIDAVYD
ncbi:MAG: hypothetical protein JRH01_07070 [Deltaproteobacteria bacterium]|nr:hypothetical protein [Deltaproteobacteria bacterium]MBW2394921.1 hypothetical protein [Deltaproteobacteria bacterium]